MSSLREILKTLHEYTLKFKLLRKMITVWVCDSTESCRTYINNKSSTHKCHVQIFFSVGISATRQINMYNPLTGVGLFVKKHITGGDLLWVLYICHRAYVSVIVLPSLWEPTGASNILCIDIFLQSEETPLKSLTQDTISASELINPWVRYLLAMDGWVAGIGNM